VIGPSLQAESDKLARSWMQHDAGVLRGYLVAGVEDPRLNLQSILSRHFLARALTAERFSALMEAEYRFAAVMNWLTGLAGRLGDAEELELVLYALGRGADNAEGIEIPGFVVQTFAGLPATAGGLTIPNYIESCLSGTRLVRGRAKLHNPSLETFRKLWHKALKAESAVRTPPHEPQRRAVRLACPVQDKVNRNSDSRKGDRRDALPYVDSSPVQGLQARSAHSGNSLPSLLPALRWRGEGEARGGSLEMSPRQGLGGDTARLQQFPRKYMGKIPQYLWTTYGLPMDYLWNNTVPAP